MESPKASSKDLLNVRVAIVQLECHPAFATQHTDWLGEPFFNQKEPCLRQLQAFGFAAAEELRQTCRTQYLEWARQRLVGVLRWFKERFPHTDQMPDIIVFPEGSVPRQHLHLLVRFAKETKITIFAGTHTFEVSEEAAQEYNQLGIAPQQSTATSQSKQADADAHLNGFEGNGPSTKEQEAFKTNRQLWIHPRTFWELKRIWHKPLDTIAVLPIIKPNDPYQCPRTNPSAKGPAITGYAEEFPPLPVMETQGNKNAAAQEHFKEHTCLDQTELKEFEDSKWKQFNRQCVVHLRAKTFLSPHELTEGGASHRNEAPEVISISLPKRAFRSQPNATIRVLPLVCAEALNLLDQPPIGGEYSLAVIVSFNENFKYFEPVIDFHSNQQKHVAYCNDGRFGDSTVSFKRDGRHQTVFFGDPNRGRLPAGDGILVADVTLSHGGGQTGVTNPMKFYRLTALAAIVHRKLENPAYHVARVLTIARHLMAGAYNDRNPFKCSQVVLRRLQEIASRSVPTKLQSINLQHLIKLLMVPCNAYRSEWEVHAWDCVVELDNENNAGTKLMFRHTGVRELDCDLAAMCYVRSGRWFEREIDEAGDRNPERAAVLSRVRRACRDRMGPVLGRVLAKLEQTKEDASTKAKERLQHLLGMLVERFGATSAWLVPVERSAGDGRFNLQRDLILTHNTAVRQASGTKAAKIRFGIVEHVLDTRRGYFSNQVIDEGGQETDPYYKTFMFTTRAEIAVPVFESHLTSPPIEFDQVEVARRDVPIAVLNLESSRAGVFLPIMLGELQAAAALVVPDLIVYQAAHRADLLTAWHPNIHQWGTNEILDQFCYATAMALSRSPEPTLTCTLWHFDRSKEVLLARGTVGFDYEYLARRILLLNESFTGKVLRLYSKIGEREKESHESLPQGKMIKQLCAPVLQIHRLNLISAKETPSSSEVGWSDFSRKLKVRNMGIGELIVVPVFRDPVLGGLGEEREDPTVGSINIYVYNHFPLGDSRRPSDGLLDGDVLRLAEYAGQMVTDIYVLQRRVVAAMLSARLAEWSQLALPPFETIKGVLLECLQADGCSVLCVDPQADSKEGSLMSIRCVATSGLSFHGVAVSPGESVYCVHDITEHEAVVQRSGEREELIKGITQTLLGRGGRTIRLLDVADIKEVGRVYLTPANSYPGREPMGKGMAGVHGPRTVRFVREYRGTEAMSPGEAYHHRYLGVSFGTADDSGAEKTALAGFRLIRGMHSRPFVRHDEYIVQDLARLTGSLFEAWVREHRRYPLCMSRYLGRRRSYVSWPPRLSTGERFEAKIEDPSAIRRRESREEAVRRLMYAAVGAVDWNRTSVAAFLQDLLSVFDDDGAILASVRLTVVGEDGQVFLRLYEVLSVYTQNPPNELHARDVSCRHSNNGWKAIFSGKAQVFVVKEDWQGIHRDSESIECGVCVPFRFFAHDHAIDGVVSVDFGRRPERGASWDSVSWSGDHVKFMLLATRQFAWSALSNNPRSSLSRDEIRDLEGDCGSAWKWLGKKLKEHFASVGSGKRMKDVKFVVRLFDSGSLGKCVIAFSPEPIRSDVSVKKWAEGVNNYRTGRRRFMEHCDDWPESQFVLYGAKMIRPKWSDLTPEDAWNCVMVFPLFIGAICVGHIDFACQFVPDQMEEGEGESLTDGSKLAKSGNERDRAWAHRSSWSKHFRELRWAFSRATEIWCQFVYGNLVLEKESKALWIIDGRAPGDAFEVTIRWGKWVETSAGFEAPVR